MLFKLVVLAILIWSFFQVKFASTVFIILIVLIEGYQFFIDKIGRPKVNQLGLDDHEFRALQKYHVYFRFPFASRSVSSTLSAIQLSSFIWVPWLLYNHLWWQAGFVAANYLIASHFAFKLNPPFFLRDAVERKGKLEFEPEMNAVDALVEKIFKKKMHFKNAKNKSIEKIIKQTTKLLREQIDGSAMKSPYWKKRFGSEFVLGYIFGYSLILIGSKTKDEKERAFGVKKVFNNLFGKEKGIGLLATAKKISNDPYFKKGYEAARQNLIEFIDKDGDRPSGLLDYLNKYKK